jgi:hypothetical protein
MTPIAPTARLARTLARNTIAASLALPALLPGLAYADAPPSPPSVPAAAAIQVSAGTVPFLLGHAIGTQNYICQVASTSSTGYAWTLVAPSATLVDDKGKQIIAHFGGPTWQANDGSTVVGARVEGVTISPSAIPWLLLGVTATTPGANGGDELTATTYIQRVNTSGGLAPESGCDATTVGAGANVLYTSDYYFYKPGVSE